MALTLIRPTGPAAIGQVNHSGSCCRREVQNTPIRSAWRIVISVFSFTLAWHGRQYLTLPRTIMGGSLAPSPIATVCASGMCHALAPDEAKVWLYTQHPAISPITWPVEFTVAISPARGDCRRRSVAGHADSRRRSVKSRRSVRFNSASSFSTNCVNAALAADSRARRKIWHRASVATRLRRLA